MRLNRKWILLIALVMSLAMATGGTLAYLQDTATTKNTFTVGNVNIELDEGNYTDNQTLLPGISIEKAPKIINSGTAPAWVWMEITVPTGMYNMYKSGNVMIDWNTTDWSMTADESKDPVVVTMKLNPEASLPVGGQTVPAFTKISIPATVTDLSGLGNGQISIDVKAFAVQADATINTLDKAIDAYNGKIFESEPGKPAVGDDDSVTYTVPDDVVEVSDTAGLLSAMNNGQTNILLKDGEYEWTDNAGNGKTLNLYGESKNVVLYITNEAADSEAADYSFHSSNVTFNGLTISSSKYVPKPNGNNYPGFAYMTATYNDCVIDQTYVLYKGPQVFNYCTLNVSGDKYNIWTWGGEDITFNHCTFNSDGKAILLYNGPTTVLNVNDCLFNDNGGLSDLKAAIEIGQDYGNRKYTLNVNNTVVNGYEINDKGISTGTTLWGNKNSMSTEDLNVIVDGVNVY